MNGIHLEDFEQKLEIMKNKVRLRNANYSAIYIIDDLTERNDTKEYKENCGERKKTTRN